MKQEHKIVIDENEIVEKLALQKREQWEIDHIIRIIKKNIEEKDCCKLNQFDLIHNLIKNHDLQLTKLINFFDASTSGYYKWLENFKIDSICPIKKRNMDYISEIYHSHDHHIGCRRVQMILKNKYQINLNYKTVNKYMNQMQLCRHCFHEELHKDKEDKE